MNSIYTQDYLTIFICMGFSIFLGLIIFGLSYLIPVQNPDSEKTSAYECGFEPFEDARNKFDVRFYIVAILFLIFDIEVVFLFPWCMTLYTIGGEAFWMMFLFLCLLILGFIYELVRKALDWQ